MDNESELLEASLHIKRSNGAGFVKLTDEVIMFVIALLQTTTNYIRPGMILSLSVYRKVLKYSQLMNDKLGKPISVLGFRLKDASLSRLNKYARETELTRG